MLFSRISRRSARSCAPSPRGNCASSKAIGPPDPSASRAAFPSKIVPPKMVPRMDPRVMRPCHRGVPRPGPLGVALDSGGGRHSMHTVIHGPPSPVVPVVPVVPWRIRPGPVWGSAVGCAPPYYRRHNHPTDRPCVFPPSYCKPRIHVRLNDGGKPVLHRAIFGPGSRGMYDLAAPHQSIQTGTGKISGSAALLNRAKQFVAAHRFPCRIQRNRLE